MCVHDTNTQITTVTRNKDEKAMGLFTTEAGKQGQTSRNCGRRAAARDVAREEIRKQAIDRQGEADLEYVLCVGAQQEHSSLDRGKQIK